MFFNWRGIAWVLGALTIVIGLCAVDLSCTGKPTADSSISRVKGELASGKREMRLQQADDLARVAMDLRVLAKRYVAQGEKKKAQRAISAAQELDKKIHQLRSAAGN